MKKYHKIDSVFMRDETKKHKNFIIGKYARPEFEYLKDCQWVFTEKVDGTNVRIAFDENLNVSFGGKTNESQLPMLLFNKLNNFFRDNPAVPNVFKPGHEIIIFAEGYGKDIQHHGKWYNADDQDVVVIDINIDGIYLKRDFVDQMAGCLNLKVVPIIGVGTLQEMIDRAKTGFKSQWGDFMAEGIVARPHVEILDRLGERIITKVKYKDFIERATAQ